jgi:4-carboxymuconolactone decarboxylase
MSDPRVATLSPQEMAPDIAEMLSVIPGDAGEPLGNHNIFLTLARHPALFKRWMRFAGYLLTRGTLPASDRELLILRTAVRCRSSYEWGQHVRISLALGVQRAVIDRVPAGPDAAGWSEHEAALLRAADELHDRAAIAEQTWQTLARTYDENQLIEATMLVGNYHMVAFALNTFGVQLDEGLESLPSEAQA